MLESGSSITSSWKRQRDLKEIQALKGLPQKKVKGDVCTRWGLKEMIKRVMEQQDAMCKVLGQDRRVFHLVPT